MIHENKWWTHDRRQRWINTTKVTCTDKTPNDHVKLIKKKPPTLKRSRSLVKCVRDASPYTNTSKSNVRCFPLLFKQSWSFESTHQFNGFKHIFFDDLPWGLRNKSLLARFVWWTWQTAPLQTAKMLFPEFQPTPSKSAQRNSMLAIKVTEPSMPSPLLTWMRSPCLQEKRLSRKIYTISQSH